MTQTGAGAGESSIAGEGAEFKRATVLAGGTGQSARHGEDPGRWPHDEGESCEGNGVMPWSRRAAVWEGGRELVTAESKQRQAGAEKGEVSGTENGGNAAVSGDISCKSSRPSSKCRRAYGAQLPRPDVRGDLWL